MTAAKKHFTITYRIAWYRVGCRVRKLFTPPSNYFQRLSVRLVLFRLRMYFLRFAAVCTSDAPAPHTHTHTYTPWQLTMHQLIETNTHTHTPTHIEMLFKRDTEIIMYFLRIPCSPSSCWEWEDQVKLLSYSCLFSIKHKKT